MQNEQEGVFVLVCIETEHNFTDFLTKLLPTDALTVKEVKLSSNTPNLSIAALYRVGMYKMRPFISGKRDFMVDTLLNNRY